VEVHYFSPSYSDALVDGVVEYGWPKIVPTSATDIYRYTPKDDVCIWMRFRIAQSDAAKMTAPLKKLSEAETTNLLKDPRRNSFWEKVDQDESVDLTKLNLEIYLGMNLCDTCYPNKDAYVALDRDSNLAYYWCE
jgi:hypothetical protein